MDRGIGERLGRGLDPDLEAFRLQPAAHHRGAQIGIVSRPAAPYDHRLAHCRHSLSRSVRLSRPGRQHRRPLDAAFDLRRAGPRRRRSGTPPSPPARGRPARRWRGAAGWSTMAVAMSATPIERNSPSTWPWVSGTVSHSPPVLATCTSPPKRLGSGTSMLPLVAVDLDRRVPVLRHVEAHGDRDHRAAHEFQRAGDMGGDLDRDQRARSSARW